MGYRRIGDNKPIPTRSQDFTEKVISRNTSGESKERILVRYTREIDKVYHLRIGLRVSPPEDHRWLASKQEVYRSLKTLAHARFASSRACVQDWVCIRIIIINRINVLTNLFAIQLII